MKLDIQRQWLSDLSGYFMPYMLRVAEARIKGSAEEEKLLYRVCKSVLNDIDIIFKRKLLTAQKSFKIPLKESEGIILQEFLLKFPLTTHDEWRMVLRDHLVHQLNKQLHKPIL